MFTEVILKKIVDSDKNKYKNQNKDNENEDNEDNENEDNEIENIDEDEIEFTISDDDSFSEILLGEDIEIDWNTISIQEQEEQEENWKE